MVPPLVAYLLLCSRHLTGVFLPDVPLPLWRLTDELLPGVRLPLWHSRGEGLRDGHPPLGVLRQPVFSGHTEFLPDGLSAVWRY